MESLNLKVLKEIFEKSLEQATRYHLAPLELMEPMVYSLCNGGKRLRPLLLLWILAIQSVDHIKAGINTAIALESIHTYSLIHDDLPAMDNDDYRRGVETNHKKFGEATAILAGDALLTDAFYWITKDDYLSDQQKVRLVQMLASAAGSIGMVAGQKKDIDAEGQELNVQDLANIHYLKTGKLFIFAVQAASVIANLSLDVQTALESFATHFGRAFQIHNDLMDELGTLASTGKIAKADRSLQKATYPRLLTLKGAKEALAEELNQARTILRSLDRLTEKDYCSLTIFLDYLTME